MIGRSGVEIHLQGGLVGVGYVVKGIGSKRAHVKAAYAATKVAAAVRVVATRPPEGSSGSRVCHPRESK